MENCCENCVHSFEYIETWLRCTCEQSENYGDYIRNGDRDVCCARYEKDCEKLCTDQKSD